LGSGGSPEQGTIPPVITPFPFGDGVTETTLDV
jgi:hypothetical protein